MQPDDIVDAELVDGADPKPMAEPTASQVSFIEQILSPQSLQWMMLSGGGLLVIGFVVWLWSAGVFEHPLAVCGAVGAVTIGLISSGVAMVRFTRHQLAGRGIALLGSIALPLNLWLYDAQGLVTLEQGGHLWIPAALFCLIYAAVARVLRDSTFVYALVGGVVLTGMLFLADRSVGQFWALMPPVTFLVVIGWVSAFAERLFVDDDGDFSRKNFGLAFHRAGLIVVAAGLTLLLGGHLAAVQTYWLFDKSWPLIASSQPHKLWALIVIAGSALGFAVQSVMHQSRLYRGATAILFWWLVPVTLNFFAIEITLSHAAIATAMTVFCGNLFVARLGRRTGDMLKLNTGVEIAGQIETYSLPVIGCLVAIAIGQLIAQSLGSITIPLFAPLGWISVLHILTTGMAAWSYAWSRPETSVELQSDRAVQALAAGTGVALAIAAGWSCIFVQTLLPVNLAAVLLITVPVILAVASVAIRNRQSTSVLQISAGVAITVHLILRAIIEQNFAASVFSFDPGLQWSAILAAAASVYWIASLGAANSVTRMFSYAAAAGSVVGLASYFGFDFGYCLVLAPMVIGAMVRVLESLTAGPQQAVSATTTTSTTRAANLLVLGSGIGGVLMALSRWVVGETSGTLLLVIAILLGCTTIVSLLTKDPAWRTAFRALIVALAGSSLCVFDGWLEIDGWQRGELCSILGGVFLLGLGHLAWSREGEQRDEAASASLLLGSLLVTVPLAIGLLVYRLGIVVDANWLQFHNITAIVAGMVLLGAGVCCKLRSTTISGAMLLGIYLLSLIALIDLPDQLQSISVMMMIGGGLFFATALLMSIYRDRIVSLPRRIREGEGVYQILKWR